MPPGIIVIYLRCGHCKKLAPVYDEVAKELLDAGSPGTHFPISVRVAKIDADEHSSVKSTYGVQGFPTLIFFHKGQQIKYNGQRSKDFMVNWLTKKTRPAVVEIEADQLSELSTNGKVNVVLHGEVDSEQGKVLQEIAAADDYNSTSKNIKPTTLSEEVTRLREPLKFTDLSEKLRVPTQLRA